MDEKNRKPTDEIEEAPDRAELDEAIAKAGPPYEANFAGAGSIKDIDRPVSKHAEGGKGVTEVGTGFQEKAPRQDSGDVEGGRGGENSGAGGTDRLREDERLEEDPAAGHEGTSFDSQS